ncbi:MAG: hypothetical protein IJY23_06825 [Clostridia bacterium]|nr:hypothetical protein [Clostridia bacterium]
MKLFFKHLFRSIKRRPTQPFILIFTLALAVAISVSAINLKSTLIDEERLADEEENGSADLVISLNSSSASRFMFTSEVKEILGTDTRCAGYYEVIAKTEEGGGAIFGAAVDFSEINDIFTFEFTEYSGVSTDTVSSSAFITEDFANENSLSLGDNVSLSIFGEEKAYTVAGISRKPFIKSYEFMVDVGGVMRLIAKDSIFASVLGSDFKPSSKILVDLAEGESPREAMANLSKSESFADKTVSAVTTRSEESVNFLKNLVDSAIILACILAAAVAFSCLFILASERSEENESFVIAGARSVTLNIMQYAEITLYWLFGSSLSVFLLFPLNIFLNSYIGFKFTSIKFDVATFSLGSLIILSVSLFTATVFILTRGRKSKHGIGVIPIITVISAATVLYVLLFLLPGGSRLIPGVLLMVLILLSAFLVTKPILRYTVSLLSKLSEKRLDCGKQNPSLHYALKNTYSVSALHNVSRLITLSVAVVLSVFTFVVSAHGNIAVSKRIFDNDYIVMGGTSRCYVKLLETEEVESVSRAYISFADHENGLYTNMISVDDISVFSEYINVTKAPTGNGAIISKGQAIMLSLEIGDTFKINENEFVVENIIDSGLILVIFDCESLGMDYNTFIPSAKAGISDTDFIGGITSALSEEVATFVSTSDILDSRVSLMSLFIKCGNVLLPSVILLAFIGILDTLAESYRTRKKEFSLYSAAGMSERSIRKMKLSEILLSVIFGFTFGLLVYILLIPVLKAIMFSMGFDAIENLLNYFRIN